MALWNRELNRSCLSFGISGRIFSFFFGSFVLFHVRDDKHGIWSVSLSVWSLMLLCSLYVKFTFSTDDRELFSALGDTITPSSGFEDLCSTE